VLDRLAPLARAAGASSRPGHRELARRVRAAAAG
jgi:hypothetical protein